MEQNLAGPKGKAGEVIWIVPLEDVVEQPRQQTWQEGREELGKGLHQRWEAQGQDFLRGLESPHTGSEKDPGPWEDTKAFLASFEQVAQACQWPREEWVARLLPALSGEAQQAFGSLEARDRTDYGKVRAAILHWEANRTETLRQHFRKFRSRELEDPRRIYSQLRELCQRWLRPERHSKEQILELLIMEQFLAILPLEQQSWIRACSPENCTQAAALVDDFLLSQHAAEAEKGQAQMDCEEMGASLHIVEETQPSQKTMFWQVLPEDNGKVYPLKGLLVPKSDQPFHLEKEEETFAQLPEECERITGPNLGDEKDSHFRMENPSHGGNQLEDPKMTQEDMHVRVEIHEERCESKLRQRKQQLGGAHESRASLSVASSRIHTANTNNGIPLFSRYGQRYHYKSGFVTENTGEDHEEGSNSENSDLDEHQRISTGDKSYKHPKPRGGFPEGVNLMRDWSSCRGEREDNFHHEQTTYTCPVCAKGFKWKQDVYRHLRIHTGDKPFQCPDCGRRFSRTDSLSTHQRSHGRKMPFECLQCGKDFCFKSLLLKHQRIHK